MNKGLKDCTLKHSALFPEVVTMLLKDGFDITIIRYNKSTFSYASWEYAEEGRTGILNDVDKTSYEPIPDHLFPKFPSNNS